MISRDFLYGAGACSVAAALAACAPKQVAEAPPSPPPVAIPPQPRPPLDAQTNLVPPPLGADGVRRTVNAGITPVQAVWNLRSAYNVAALDCQRPEHAAILPGYKAFLKTHAKRLAAINKAVDKQFVASSGAGRSAVRAREAYMTQVYNFYALPPTLPAFCDAALAMSTAAATLPPKDLDAFAAENLPRLDLVFLQFYDSYDQYRADLAAWRQRYAPTTAPAAAIPTLTQAAPSLIPSTSPASN